MLGNGGNNNEKKNYDPVVYSPYKLSNAEGVEPSGLSFSFWNNMLKVTITALKVSTDGSISYDNDSELTIYMTHPKARILFNEIEEYQKNPDVYSNVGVNTPSCLISLSNGKEFGVNADCLVIRKINETGVVESQYVYQFRTEYHYGIRNYDDKTSNFDRVYYDTLEIEMFKSVLSSYYEAMTGAVAYSIIDQMKYNNSRINTKLDGIANKLGIEYPGKNGRSNSGKSSFFNGKKNESNNTRFDTATIDDIDSQIG